MTDPTSLDGQIATLRQQVRKEFIPPMEPEEFKASVWATVTETAAEWLPFSGDRINELGRDIMKLIQDMYDKEWRFAELTMLQDCLMAQEREDAERKAP